MTSTQNTSAYDARFSSILGGEEYDELLLALDWYNEFEAKTGDALKKYLETHLQDAIEIKVLEAGPGTGITTLELIKADPRVKVVAVDNEPKMLNVVKERFATIEELKNRVEFVLSDILAFLESCPDESFDVFSSVYTLHNFTPDFRNKVIELISKKLKKGGLFINGDKYAQDDETAHNKDLDAEINSYDKFEDVADEVSKTEGLERAHHFHQVRSGWIDHMWEDDKVKITVSEQNEMFERLGFKDVEWGKRYDLVVTVSAIKI
ncbi:MAG: methyltransferase domain-containing protein [bacterium]